MSLPSGGVSRYQREVDIRKVVSERSEYQRHVDIREK